MIFEHASYRSYLRATLAERVSQNPSYSLRTLAYELGMAHSSLSEVLSARKNFSLDTAARVAARLGLEGPAREYFSLLVQFESAKEPELREAVLTRMRVLNPSQPPRDLSVDAFQMIADWYHYAILELLRVRSVRFTPDCIATKLGITPLEAEAALERLVRLELLERDEKGHFRKTKDYVVARSGKNDSAIRKFNRQMLHKALESLESQDSDERLGGSETFAINRSVLGEARELVDEFLQKMAKLSEKGSESTDVYHLNLQLFNLTPERKK